MTGRSSASSPAATTHRPLECGIALGFLVPGIEIGDSVEIDQRGQLVAARVVKPPFVNRPT